jgi:hypothetical protein
MLCQSRWEKNWDTDPSYKCRVITNDRGREELRSDNHSDLLRVEKSELGAGRTEELESCQDSLGGIGSVRKVTCHRARVGALRPLPGIQDKRWL